MSATGRRRLAWVIWAFQLVVLVLGIVLLLVAPGSPDMTWGTPGNGLDATFRVALFAFPSVGLLITLRQPGHRMGWLLLVGVGLANAVVDLMDAYSTYALVRSPGSLPAGAVVAALTEGSWVWAIGSIGIFVILLFPDGRLPSPRWRWLPWTGGLVVATLPIGVTLSETTLTESPVPGLRNPLYVPAAASPQSDVLGYVLLALLPLCIAASAVALVLRFRRSHGIERVQLTWLAGAGAVVALCYLAAMGGNVFIADPFGDTIPLWLQLVQDVATSSFGLVPIAIGIAILRHRLYDIDVVIKRTLVYGTLTATLALVYLALVLAPRALPGELVGDSDLAVAGSTLAVAALFRPLRRRIQAGVDRRFFRRAYDAGRTLDAFSDRLRQEVDLRHVSDDLQSVISETMQPDHLSLWLREAAS